MSTLLKNYLNYISLRYLQKYTCNSVGFIKYLERKSKTKLNTKELEPDVKDLIIEITNSFIEKKYINDKEYAEMQTRRLLRRGKSITYVKSALKNKGADPKEGIEGVMEEYQKTSEELNLEAAKLFAKRKSIGIYRKNKEEEYTKELRKKHLAKLLQAGFPYTIAKQMLENNNDDEDYELLNHGDSL